MKCFVDELKEWLSKAEKANSEMRTLLQVQSPSCSNETEARCWKFLETRLSLLLAQYKTPNEASKMS